MKFYCVLCPSDIFQNKKPLKFQIFLFISKPDVGLWCATAVKVWLIASGSSRVASCGSDYMEIMCTKSCEFRPAGCGSHLSLHAGLPLCYLSSKDGVRCVCSRVSLFFLIVLLVY